MRLEPLSGATLSGDGFIRTSQDARILRCSSRTVLPVEQPLFSFRVSQADSPSFRLSYGNEVRNWWPIVRVLSHSDIHMTSLLYIHQLVRPNCSIPPQAIRPSPISTPAREQCRYDINTEPAHFFFGPLPSCEKGSIIGCTFWKRRVPGWSVTYAGKSSYFNRSGDLLVVHKSLYAFEF